MVKTPKLIVIVGVTGSGKSDLAMELAKRFRGEIICADSSTVRKYMDIGTAKPSKEDQDRIPHHLLNVVEPDEPFTAADFKQLAIKAIEVITNRGNIPIIVGGSGLYIDSILFDYGFLPKKDSERHKLNDLSSKELLAIAKKRNLDVSKVDTKNPRRLIRLIETKGDIPTKDKLRPNTLIIGLKSERKSLVFALELRLNTMLEIGLEREVSALNKRYAWDSPGLQSIGYREWHEYFLGRKAHKDVQLDILKNSINLAKRQVTWFKRNKAIQWFTTPVELSDVVAMVTTFLDS